MPLGRTIIPYLLYISRNCFPELSFSSLTLRVRLVRSGLACRREISELLSSDPTSAIGAILLARPEILGVLVWPYQCTGWSPQFRLARLVAHYKEINRIGAPFIFEPDEKLRVFDLSDQFPDLGLVIDQPRWFMREGGLVLNLFIGKFRAYSLAFSLFRTENGNLAATIGALQGRNVDGSVPLYRDLTKALFGIRPRDFLIEAFRVLCRSLEITEIYAVTQAHRHHQDPYFGDKRNLSPDYNTIWEERGGVRFDDKFYLLDIATEKRDLGAVKANKRSLYRKRYIFLDEFELLFARNLIAARPERFVDT